MVKPHKVIRNEGYCDAGRMCEYTQHAREEGPYAGTGRKQSQIAASWLDASGALIGLQASQRQQAQHAARSTVVCLSPYAFSSECT